MNIVHKTFCLTLIGSTIALVTANQHTISIPLKNFFEAVYRNNSWVNPNTRSGSGSDMPETPIIRAEVPELLKQIGARTLLDAGCGEFFWLKEVNLDFLDSYIGLDIVEPIINHNQFKYGSPKIRFSLADITKDALPQVDVILCRDVLQHLVDLDVKRALKNIKLSNSRYLLTSTFREKKENSNPVNQESPILSLLAGSGRNFEIAPFNFPAPLMHIDEGFNGKTLALWEIKDLPDYTDEIAHIDRSLKNTVKLLEE